MINRHIKKIFEDFMAAPTKSPTKTPTKNPTTPKKRPGRPGPIPTERPSVKPKPMASADDVYDRFITELRSTNGEIEFDLKFLSSKYKMSESQVVKGFAQFIYEASLEDNPGLPGAADGDDADKYLSNIEGRADQMMSDTQSRYGNRVNQFMELVGEVNQLQAGKETEMEDLAERAIREFYGSILDGVKLDIKFPEEKEEMADVMEPVEMDPPEMEEIEDEETIREIHKRKITNNITQGEAKNTKLILVMPFISDGLKEIFGEEDGAKMVSLLTDITNIASFFDWAIPIERQKGMWASKDGFAGTVQVDWEEEEVEEEEEKNVEDIIAGLEAGDDILDMSDEAEELFNEVTPVISARGLDFAMLIHETVKGIYQLITSIGIPKDEEMAKLVVANTDTLAGELEDLRYGPYIAEDLNKFITSFSENEEIDNLKEHFYGKLIALPAAEFLELVRLILMEDESAKGKAQELIDEVVKEIEDWEADGISSYGDEEDDDFEIDDYGQTTPSPVMSDDESFKAMSNSELQELIDDALDVGDFDEVSRLAKYLKESLRIQLEEQLTESRFSHISSFNSFKKKEEFRLDESIKNGNAYFIKTTAELEGHDPASLTDDERERIGNLPDWLAIRKLIEDNNRAGDTVAFVKFFLNQQASFDNLSRMMELLTDPSNKNIISSLPMSLAQYASIKYNSTGEERPGWEVFIDDVSSSRSKKDAEWIVKNLSNKAGTRDYQGQPIPGATGFNQREAFKNASPEIQNKLLASAMELFAIDTDGKEVKSFSRRLGNKKSLEQIQLALDNKISSAGSKMTESVRIIDESYPAASVVWEGNDKFIAIFRSPNMLGSMCGGAGWCLIPRSFGGSDMFYSYIAKGNGTLLYVFFDFSIPTSNNMHLMGVTVAPGGNVTHAHDKANNNIYGSMGSELDTYFDKFEVDNDARAQIKSKVKDESNLMLDVTPYYKATKESNPKVISDEWDRLIKRTENRANEAKIRGEEFKRQVVVDGLIASDITNSNNINEIRNILIDSFYDRGVTNVEAAKYFSLVFKGSDLYTDESINKVLRTTEIKLQKLKEFISKYSRMSSSDKLKFERAKSNQKSGGGNKWDAKNVAEYMKKISESTTDAIAYLQSLKTTN
jgi:hypothetical protein